MAFDCGGERGVAESGCEASSRLSRVLRSSGCRARGLGVMTSPSHGEDRRFNSCRAHHLSLNPSCRAPSSATALITSRCAADSIHSRLDFKSDSAEAATPSLDVLIQFLCSASRREEAPMRKRELPASMIDGSCSLTMVVNLSTSAIVLIPPEIFRPRFSAKARSWRMTS